jgi:CRP/FNR family nitrogen fixation transcriptional regulator
MSVSLVVATTHGVPALPAALLPGRWTTSLADNDGVALNGTAIRFPPDRQIYAEGDEARSFYKVVRGVLRTCRFLSDGRRQIDAFHIEGDVFGFEAGADHRLSAEAVSDCSVIAFRRRGLEAILAQDARLGRWFFSHAMTSLARAREHSLLLGRGSAAVKISAFLLEVAEREGCDSVVELAMSRQDIADYLGLTIETVSRTMSQLEREGTIGLPTARRVMLKNRMALRALDS